MFLADNRRSGPRPENWLSTSDCYDEADKPYGVPEEKAEKQR